MRVLVVTRQFPSSEDPRFATFNRQQFAALAKRCTVEVLASIPWFPFARLFARWSAAGRLVRVPRRESIAGLDVEHPRYLHLPRIGHLVAGLLYFASLARAVLRRRGRVDVLLASWAFPDGVGGVALARVLGVPSVVKVHGSDMNVLARMPPVARNLRWALPRAGRVVAVSRALAEVVESFGVPRDRIDVIGNGVDAERFRPRDRGEARAAIGRAGDSRWWETAPRVRPARRRRGGPTGTG
jgi:teichuronic acid biosynthesis glycosyltransferase TuaC